MGIMGISKDLIEFLQLEEDSSLYDEVLDDFDKEYDDWDNYDYMEGGVSYFDNNKCPGCKRNYNIIHFECGEYIDKCICPRDVADTVYYCTPCDMIWDTSTNEVIEDFSLEFGDQDSLFDDDDFISDDPYSPEMQAILNGDTTTTTTVTTNNSKNKWVNYQNNAKSKGAVTTTKTTDYNYNYKKCTHKHDEIKLYDGTPIYCSSVRDKSTDLKSPDFGLYADSSWRPLWRNEFITWPDYGIPTHEELGLTQIYEAFFRAQNGAMVEIGCIGGHGRTGTILAIMYIASAEGKVNGKEAFDFVKKNYCEHAIESDIQEWYINFASAFWYGTELPEKPTPAKTNTTAWCNVTDHYAMMLRGHQKCSTAGDSCKYWGQDWNLYHKKDKVPHDFVNFYTALGKTKDYDYVFGGIVQYTDDHLTNGCSPLDHYIMITKGHEECIRLPGKCTFWEKDMKEWMASGSINGESDWSDNGKAGEYLDKIYPTVEEWKVLKEINELLPQEIIVLGEEIVESDLEGKK